MDQVPAAITETLARVQQVADTVLARPSRLSGLTDQAIVEVLIAGYFRACGGLPQRPHLVDVGGAYGSVAKVFLGLGWSADVFDPDPNCQRILSQMVAAFADRCRLWPHAVGKANLAQVAFKQNSTPGLSGLADSPFGKTVAALPVRCVRLADFLPSVGVSHVELLKIDTEGNDFDVLEGYDLAALPPRLVFVEYSFYFSGQDVAALSAAVQRMRGLGYHGVIFDYDDSGNFTRGNWAHRLVQIITDGTTMPARKNSFGNVLFYRADDAVLVRTLAELITTLG